jgi:hypothetical protein
MMAAVCLWLAAATTPANAAEHAVDPAVETTEAEATVVSPSGVAGLSLLGAAVVAVLWNVAMGERRARVGAGR